jgi:hypothetical protein
MLYLYPDSDLRESAQSSDDSAAESADALATGVRRLTPANCEIFRGTFSLLHCTVLGDQIYRGVFASLCFPVKHPNRFISLRYHSSKGKAEEIGLIEDLTPFPDKARELVLDSLHKHYHEQFIERVDKVTFQFGLLHFDVQTGRGQEHFTMRWQTDRAQDYGDHGKVLLDSFENRYVITDVEQLPARDRARLRRYIYW